MLNTYEHGYTDGIRGHRLGSGSPEYQAGYQKAVRYRRAEMWVTLLVAATLALGVGAVMAMTVADLAGRMPV